MVLYCHITSRIEGRKNDDLLRQKSDRVAFPTMLFLNADGDVLAKHQEARTAAGFNGTLTKVKGFLAAKEKAKSGEPEAVFEVFLARVDLGQLGFADAQAKLKDLPKPTAAQKARLDGLLVNLEFTDLRKRMRQLGREGFAGKLAQMESAGRIPSGNNEWMFYYYLMVEASRRKQIAKWESYLEKVKVIKADDKGFQRFIDSQQKALEKAKKAAGGG